MTIGEETHQKLRRAQDLLRHVVPSGDLAAVFDRALTVLVADLEKRKLAKRRPRTAAPTRPRGRHVPAAVRRAVWARDGGRCTFVGPAGRCSETGFLELHHVVPYARGGEATVDNERFYRARDAFSAPRFKALYKAWKQDGEPALVGGGSRTISDAVEARAGRVEVLELGHRYGHLSPLAAIA